MNRILILSLFLLPLTGCIFQNEQVQRASGDIRQTVDQTVQQGRETVGVLHQNAVETKQKIDEKLDQAEQVAREIAEAREALRRLFGDAGDDLNDIDLCEGDDDCVIVEYDGCCSRQKAINREFVEVYKIVPSLQKDSIDCRMVECTVQQYENAVCQFDSQGAQRCTLVSNSD